MDIEEHIQQTNYSEISQNISAEKEKKLTKLLRLLNYPVHEPRVVGVHEPRRVVVLPLKGLNLRPEQHVVVIGQAVVGLEAAGPVEVGFAGSVAEEGQEDREAARGEDARDDDVNGAKRDQFLLREMGVISVQVDISKTCS
jgi:hypothetical protein